MDWVSIIGLIVAIIGTIGALIQTWIAWEQHRNPNGSSQPHRSQYRTNQSLLRIVLFASVIITSLLMGVARPVGMLQHGELQAFDVLMRLRPHGEQDERLLIVTVTEEDLKYQDDRGMQRRGSLSDAALAKLLEKLEPHQPRVIGLDIYRDFPAQTDLANQLQQKANFFAVCKGSNPATGDIGVSPPPGIPLERLGFADVIEDSDGVLRRYLWYANYSSDSPCQTEKSLSLQLALYYLAEKGIKPQGTPEGYLQVKDIQLRPLASPAGGYQKFDDFGYQMLLNYRTRGNIAQSMTLTDILQNKFDPRLVKDRVVLIGVTAESVPDNFLTPFSRDPRQAMRGVFVQGQMVSQVLSAVLDGRPLLSVWAKWAESLWVWLWGLAGGLLTWHCRRLRYLILFETAMMAILFSICFLLFILGWWIPLVPSALALIATGAIGVAYRISLTSQMQNLNF